MSWLGNLPGAAPRLSEQDTRELMRRAEREGVAGIVAQRLRSGGVCPDWLQTLVAGWFGRSARHHCALQQLAEPLGRQGLQVIALKGGALLPTVYAGQFSCRPLSDLDLLVRPEDLEAVQALTERVLGPSGSGVYLDWHHHLVDDHRIPTKARLCHLSAEQLWQLSVPFRGGIRHLTPELTFIHLTLHAFKHSCYRLLWLVDLALVGRTCELELLLDLARQVGALRPVVVALHLLRRLLGEPTRGWKPTPLRLHELLAVRLACRRGHGLGWGEAFLALSVPGWKHKLRYLREYLYPGPSVLGEGGRSHRLRASLRRLRKYLTNPDRNRGC